MPLISNPSERMQRAADKRQALLRFLRDELYTTPATAGLVLGLTERPARRTLAALEREGLIKRHDVQILPGLPPVRVIGITHHGQAMAFSPGAGEKCIERAFEPARYSLVGLQHKLDMQALRLQSANAGLVKQWVNGDRLALAKKGVKRPDAVCLTATGVRVAVEVERTIKAPKRYAAVLEQHLAAIRAGRWSRVVWACPDAPTAERVAALVRGVEYVTLAGAKEKINPAKDHAGLLFTDYQSFTTCLQ